MTQLTMHQASAPLFLRGLRSLASLLGKAGEHCRERQIDEGAFLAARLYPDMLTFTRQVQLASDFAHRCMARLAGEEPARIEDAERSFAELIQRVERTAALVDGFSASQVDGSEEREITLTVGGETMRFTGRSYLLGFALPNFWFHHATAYGLLRHGGVVIGKRDFIGAID